MSTVGTDLGACGAFTSTGRCDGHLIVDREDGQMLEAVCDRCGDVAACPVMSRFRDERREAESEREQMAF